MRTAVEIEDILNHCTGTSAYHKYSIIPFFPVLTDGAKLLADMAECYWLMDVIGSYQTDAKLDKDFQVWTLEVDHEEESGVVKGFNDTDLIITQEIPYTDFPMEQIKLYLIRGVILLPSEY